MRILVTRPRNDCEEMVRELEAAGHQVVVSPLLEIKFEPVSGLSEPDLAALIITSQNALRSLARSPELPRLLSVQVVAVGPRTARLAGELGFRNVVEGPGMGSALAQVIKASSLSKGDRIVHLSGDKLAFDMTTALSAEGYRIENIRCYRSIAATAFSAEAEAAIRNGEIDLVILMSPRSAETFIELAKSAGLEQNASVLSYACISDASGKLLKDEGWLRTHVALAPNGQEVVALVNRMAAQSQQ